MAMVTLVAGQRIKASELNTNFANSVACDTARTISVTHTWSASQTFTGGFTTGAAATFGAAVTVSTGGLTVTAGGLTVTAGGLTVSASGITVTGNSTITGTLGGLTGLTVASGGLTITSGTLTIPSRIVNTSGDFDIDSNGANAVRINRTSGTGGFVVFAGGTTTENLRITDAGVTTFRAGVSGITTLAGTGAISGFTSITLTGLIQTTLTTQQLSLRYDASNHLAVTVASNGAVTYNATGAGAAHTFSDAVNTGVLVVENAATGQFTVRYDSSNYLVIGVESDGATTLNAVGAGGAFSFQDNIATTGSYTSAAPSGVTARAWKFGEAHSVSPTAQNRTLSVDVNGTVYYISAKTTND